jgi:hypothetical protein
MFLINLPLRDLRCKLLYCKNNVADAVEIVVAIAATIAVANCNLKSSFKHP